MIVSRPTASMSRAPIQSHEFSAGTAMNGVMNSAQAHQGAGSSGTRHGRSGTGAGLTCSGLSCSERLLMGGTIVDTSLAHGRKLRRQQ
jgi:hypothetical protein